MNADELARQLSCPSGEHGTEVGENMYKSNLNMIHNCIEALKLTDNSIILELGFGNGAHINKILEKTPGGKYFGVEISELMINEARKNNPALGSECLIFTQDSSKLNFPENTFDAFLSSNTLYFWKDIKQQIAEIYRVLKPDGQFSVSFVEKEFGLQLPFTQFGFNLYSEKELEKLLTDSGFRNIKFETYSEKTMSKDGNTVDRIYLVCSCLK